MLDEYTVSVAVRDRETHQIGKRAYPFTDYCNDVGYALKRLLNDVENLFLDTKGERDTWDAETIQTFSRMRSRILDCANNIERLPESLCYGGKNINMLTGSQYVSKLIGE